MANAGTRITRIVQAVDAPSALAALLAAQSDAQDIVMQFGPPVRTGGLIPTGVFEVFCQYTSVAASNPVSVATPLQKSANLDNRGGMAAGLPDIFN